MKHIMIIGIFSAATQAAGAPQAPIAAGPVQSILETLVAAKACHITEIRIALYPSEKDEARLFLMQDPQDESVKCLDRWMTINGRKLRLEPRWWNDDFTKDRP